MQLGFPSLELSLLPELVSPFLLFGLLLILISKIRLPNRYYLTVLDLKTNDKLDLWKIYVIFFLDLQCPLKPSLCMDYFIHLYV